MSVNKAQLTEGHTDRQAEKQTDRQRDRETDKLRQTDRH